MARPAGGMISPGRGPSPPPANSAGVRASGFRGFEGGATPPLARSQCSTLVGWLTYPNPTRPAALGNQRMETAPAQSIIEGSEKCHNTSWLGPRRERSNRSGAAGQESGRHEIPVRAGGDSASTRLAAGWIAFRHMAWPRRDRSIACSIASLLNHLRHRSHICSNNGQVF